jgi:amidohydrolase
MKSLFKQDIEQYTDQIVAWRRDFHQHPELGFEENRTAEIVADVLQTLDLEVKTGIAETGVVGLLQGGKPGPTAMLRVDMDALPIHENTGLDFASINPGVMHACGHDGHMAIGLGVATLLARHRAELPGQVKFVFQPAEEGLGGAEKMLEEGVLENPKPDFALGVHLWNTEPVGWLGIAPGARMAAADILEMEVVGKGGHGAAPHLAHDPIVATAHIITALQTIVSRNVDSEKPAVVSLAEIHGGETFNVIPEVVRLSGTVRTFDSEVRQMILERIEQIARQVGEAMDCQASVKITPLTPALVNDPDLTLKIKTLAQALFPKADTHTQQRIMGSEDMAIFLERVPGCFIFVGSANSERGLDASHHNPQFNFDERALPMAVELLSNALWEAMADQ